MQIHVRTRYLMMRKACFQMIDNKDYIKIQACRKQVMRSTGEKGQL
jgi:hypothetical protein